MSIQIIKIIAFISIFSIAIVGVFSLALADTNIPPGDIMDLQAVSVGSSSIQFSWTAPGADSGDFTESVSSYDFRQASSPITYLNWNSQVKINSVSAPSQPIMKETFTLTGLSPNTTYYFSVRGVDSFGVLSQFSNAVQVTTLASSVSNVSNVTFVSHLEGIVMPAQVNFNISFFNVGSGVRIAEFTATADSSGNVALPGSVSLSPGAYDILVSSPNYLRKKLGNYNLASGATVNLPILPAGDFDGNNLVNSLDSSFMTTRWFTNNATADINKDGLVNSIDLSFVTKNWFKAGD